MFDMSARQKRMLQGQLPAYDVQIRIREIVPSNLSLVQRRVQSSVESSASASGSVVWCQGLLSQMEMEIQSIEVVRSTPYHLVLRIEATILQHHCNG